jgi:nitroimidazol reductase NimA-like FMN-containing flavoprotein (pyridoxamine 5'-phosphate oxidase superfamily)
MAEMIELGRDECLAMLADEEIGRVAFHTPLGPRVVPINFRLHDDEILMCTTPFSELGTYGRDTEVAFEVDQIDAHYRCGTSAVALGHLEPIEDYDEARRLLAETALEPWANSRARHLYLRLHIRDLTGRRIPPAARVS